MVPAVVFEFCVMRCQPLRRALWHYFLNVEIGNMKKILLLVFPLFILFGCGESIPKVDAAKDYKILSVDDFSFQGRKRTKIIIVSPDAKNSEEFVHTAISVAYDQQTVTKSDVVTVFLEPDKELVGYGYAYAIVNYAPDGKGNSGKQDWKWEAESASSLIPESSLEIAKLWYSHRSSFQKDGLTNEPELISFLAQKYALSEENIRLPWVGREKYQVK